MIKVAKLTEKQQRFIDYYLQSGNGAAAAKKAGYAEKTANVAASKMLANVTIKSKIDERLKELESRRVAETKEILEYLTAVMRGEGKEIVVVTIGTGKGFSQSEKVEVPLNTKDRLKTVEHLAKINGMFKEKVDVGVDASTLLIDTLTNIWTKRDRKSAKLNEISP